ncbi:MAG: hypothetical protein GXO75_19060 [Calditrichaeota bacterium]|nr:hypothetical protein [Calditrichota bacterium]
MNEHDRKRFVITLFVVAALFILALLVLQNHFFDTQAYQYQKTFGGNILVYEKIFQTNDCNELLDALNLLDRQWNEAKWGTPKHKWLTGYIAAVYHQLGRLECGKNFVEAK